MPTRHRKALSGMKLFRWMAETAENLFTLRMRGKKCLILYRKDKVGITERGVTRVGNYAGQGQQDNELGYLSGFHEHERNELNPVHLRSIYSSKTNKCK
jgi:hypothetical protein